MAGGNMLYVCHSGSVATTASTLKTILAVAGTSTQDIALFGWQISMDVTTAQTPCLVEVVRFSALGTSSGSPTAYRFASVNDRAANGVPKSTWSVEPTRGDVLEQFFLTPNSPTVFMLYPLGQWPNYDNSASHALGISVTPAASSTPNVRASLYWSE